MKKLLEPLGTPRKQSQPSNKHYQSTCKITETEEARKGPPCFPCVFIIAHSLEFDGIPKVVNEYVSVHCALSWDLFLLFVLSNSKVLEFYLYYIIFALYYMNYII